MSAASARGLFRATGKQSKPVAVDTGQDLVGRYERAEHLEREADDFYPTPPEPIRALLSAEITSLRRFPVIWESAAGDGALTREMEALGLTVFQSDLIDRDCGAEIRSFYDYRKPASKAIVTNPPFQECNSGAWVKHALETLGVDYMAPLLPVNWLGAKSRANLWERYPPARMYLMRWRIDFTGQGAPPMLNAWYVWDVEWEGETALRMLDKTNCLQMEMFASAS